MTGHFAIVARGGVFPATVAALVALSAGVAAADWPNLVRVEQDWELVVGAPDPDTNAPQITCVISPTGGVASLYAVLEINQQNMETYSAGGLQLQVWDGDFPVTDRSSPHQGVLATPGEVVTWTQSMELGSGALTFEVSNANSTTWGNFGGNGLLRTTVPTALTNLNHYRSSVSVAQSRAGYAINRVQSLVLMKVRYYLSTGEVIEDLIPKFVHWQD